MSSFSSSSSSMSSSSSSSSSSMSSPRWCTQIRDFGLQHICGMRNLHILSVAGRIVIIVLVVVIAIFVVIAIVIFVVIAIVIIVLVIVIFVVIVVIVIGCKTFTLSHLLVTLSSTFVVCKNLHSLSVFGRIVSHCHRNYNLRFQHYNALRCVAGVIILLLPFTQAVRN